MVRSVRKVLYGAGVLAALFLVFMETRADCRVLTQSEQFAIFGGNVPIVIGDPPEDQWQNGKRCAQQTSLESPCYKTDVVCSEGLAYCQEDPASRRDQSCITAVHYYNPTRCGVSDLTLKCRLRSIPPPEFEDMYKIECYDYVVCKCNNNLNANNPPQWVCECTSGTTARTKSWTRKCFQE